MWVVALETSPVPASPLERIIAAPSVMPAQRLAQVGRAAHERHGERPLVDVVGVVGRGQHLGLVDVVDAERLQHLGLDEVADAGLGHHRDRDRGDDAVDHVRVAHPGHAALGADVGRHPLERHHRDRAGVLGDLGLLGGDHVHDHAALEHLGHAALDAGGAGDRVGAMSTGFSDTVLRPPRTLADFTPSMVPSWRPPRPTGQSPRWPGQPPYRVSPPRPRPGSDRRRRSSRGSGCLRATAAAAVPAAAADRQGVPDQVVVYLAGQRQPGGSRARPTSAIGSVRVEARPAAAQRAGQVVLGRLPVVRPGVAAPLAAQPARRSGRPRRRPGRPRRRPAAPGGRPARRARRPARACSRSTRAAIQVTYVATTTTTADHAARSTTWSPSLSSAGRSCVGAVPAAAGSAGPGSPRSRRRRPRATRCATTGQSKAATTGPGPVRQCRPGARVVEQVAPARRPAHPASPTGNSDTGPATVQHPAERVEVAGHHRGTGRHRLGEDHAERLAAGVRRDVDVDAAQHPGLVRLGDLAEEGDSARLPPAAGRRSSGSPGPATSRRRPGRSAASRRERVEQDREALARLGEPAEEADRAGRPRASRAAARRRRSGPPRPRWGSPTRRRRGAPPVPVRARSLTAIRAVILSRTSWSSPWAAAIARDRVIAVWKVATTGPRGVEHGEHRQARRDRLVDVQHVEVAGGQPAAYPGGRDRAERQPGDRAVVPDRYRPPGRHHVGRQRRRPRRPGPAR